MKHRLPLTYAKAAYQLLSEGSDPKLLGQALVKSITKNRDKNRLAEILEQLRLLAERGGKDVVTITTATPEVAQAISPAVKPLATHAHIVSATDQSLIGGIKIQREDVQIDASLSSLLHDLSLSLT